MEAPAGSCILVGEDNESVGYLLKLILEKAGYCVLQAKNGKELVEIFEQNSISMVVTDIQMPVMIGSSAARLIRENLSQTGRHMPIVAITGVDVDNIDKVMEDGCFDDYIIKPFTKDMIVNMVKKHLNPQG